MDSTSATCYVILGSVCLDTFGILAKKWQGGSMDHNNGDVKSYLAGFVVGGLMAAAVVLLSAPRSGRETREELRTRGIELEHSAEETADDILETLRAVSAEIGVRTEELRSQSRVAMEQAQKQWTGALEEIRRIAEQAIEEVRRTAS
jgi:gas vesicle protein